MIEEEFEIKEPSEYTNSKEESYSHSQLVMSALKDCKNNRAKEMRDGYWNIKFDRMGNAHRVWMPDSRQEFIESVESLMMIQERDYDDDVITNIKQIEENLNEKYEEYCGKEKEDWNKMPVAYKQFLAKKGSYFREGMLSKDMPYIYEYTRHKVESYTKIVSEIQKLIKKMGDYKEEIIEA